MYKRAIILKKDSTSVTDGFRIVMNANDLGVAGVALTDLLICWVLDVAASVTGLYFVDASQLREEGFGAPETASTKNCLTKHACVNRIFI